MPLDYQAGFRLLLTFLLLALLFGLFIRYLLHLHSEKVLDLGEAAAALLAVLAYMGQVLMRWDTVWGPLLLVLGFAFVPLLYLASREVARRSERAMQQEDALKWERSALHDPRNAAAHYFLGEVYLEAGAYSAALESMSRALELSPQDREYRVGRDRARLRIEEAPPKMTRCPVCAAPLESGATLCPACVRRAVERAESEPPVPKPLPRWLAFVLAGVLVLTAGASVGGLLPGWLAATLSVATLVATGFYVHRMMRG